MLSGVHSIAINTRGHIFPCIGVQAPPDATSNARHGQFIHCSLWTRTNIITTLQNNCPILPLKKLISNNIEENLTANQTNILDLPEWKNQDKKTYILTLNAEMGILYLSVKDPRPPNQCLHHYTLTHGLHSRLK